MTMSGPVGVIINTDLESFKKVDDEMYNGLLADRFRPQEINLPTATNKEAAARFTKVLLMQFGNTGDNIIHRGLYNVFKKPECAYTKLSYRIYKTENPKLFESTKTQKGFV